MVVIGVGAIIFDVLMLGGSIALAAGATEACADD
jgi:hypothetical protein